MGIEEQGRQGPSSPRGPNKKATFNTKQNRRMNEVREEEEEKN